MINKKIIAVTNCESHLSKRFGLDKCLNSFRYFHPDIEIVNFDETITKPLCEAENLNLWAMMPAIILKAKKDYNANLVIKLDTDSIILSRFTEIIDCEDDTEIFGVRNDGKHHVQNEEINRPPKIRNLPNSKYLNCGLIATGSEDFLNEWLSYNKYLIEKYGDIRNAREECPVVEQGSYNIIAHSQKYKLKILDDISTNLLYGASANMPSPNNHPIPESIYKYHDGISIWKSWKDIEYKDGKFWLYGSLLKAIHMQGGSMDKIQYDMFTNEIADKIRKICNE